MKKIARPHLLHILDTLEVIVDFTPNTFEAFMADRNAQDATLMRIQDIGEQLSIMRTNFPEFYEMHSSDEWNKLIGMRNIIAHGYREVEFSIVWKVIKDHLAPFSASINKALESA